MRINESGILISKTKSQIIMKIKSIIYWIILFMCGCASCENSFDDFLDNAYSKYSKIRNEGLYFEVEQYEYTFDKKDAAEFLQKLKALPLFAENNGGLKKLLTDYDYRSKYTVFTDISIDMLSYNYKTTGLCKRTKFDKGEKITYQNSTTFSAIDGTLPSYYPEDNLLLITYLEKEAIPYYETPFIKMYLLNPYIYEKPLIELTHSSIKYVGDKIITKKCVKACTESTFEMKGDFPIRIEMLGFINKNTTEENKRVEVYYRGYKPFATKSVSEIYFPSISIEADKPKGDIQEIRIAHIKIMKPKPLKKSDLEIKVDKNTKIKYYPCKKNSQ